LVSEVEGRTLPEDVQYKVRRRMFGPRRDEGIGIWGRLRKEELNDLYPSPNIFRVIETRKM